ncbi:MAG: hypothetical protein KDB55_17940 [Mycobacterium sp.]|nr:hypothetical protein [Mycobacterium sp.]
MTTNKNTNANRTNAIRRLIAGAILGAAPLLIAVGTATAAHAETTTSNSPDPGFHAPAHHEAFPEQTNQPAPGTPTHHHHQHHHHGG